MFACSQDRVLICGHREAAVLEFDPTSRTHCLYLLQVTPEPSQVILRGMWLPGSQSRCALITPEHALVCSPLQPNIPIQPLHGHGRTSALT